MCGPRRTTNAIGGRSGIERRPPPARVRPHQQRRQTDQQNRDPLQERDEEQGRRPGRCDAFGQRGGQTSGGFDEMAMDVSFHMLKENPVIVGADCPGTPIMSNHAIPHRTDLTDAAESPTTETLVALAHAHRQGIPDEIGAQWLARLPERLRTLADWVAGRQDGRR